MNGNNTFNISSKNQTGGITAGIVNIFHKTKIELSDENKQQITEILINKSDTINVSLQTGGGSELTQLAEDIKLFLLQQGYKNILGVHTIWGGFAPFKGIRIEKNPTVIFIGALQ